MFIIKNRQFFIGLAIALVLSSWLSIAYFGLNLGIDFRGGVLLEVEYQGERPPPPAARELLAGLSLGQVTVQPTGDSGMIFRFREMGEGDKEAILAHLEAGGRFSLTEKRFNSIGPVIGRELYRRGLAAVAVAVVLITLYIAFVFRKVSSVAGGVGSWKYGLIAIAALVHDISIPAGIFAWLGYYRGVEIDSLFLTAVLTVLGISVNDTIVVFDRIRENLRSRRLGSFAEAVGKSLEQTFVRAINTSLTTILVLLAIFFLGGVTTRYFALALVIGMAVGTYSSLFVAAPLLVVWGKKGSP